MDFNLKNDLAIGFNAIKNTTKACFPELVILGLTIYGLLNNLNRFSNKTLNIVKLTNKNLVFIYSVISLILIIILIYCKLFFVTDSINKFTIFLPILFILIPFMSGIIVTYLETNQIMKSRRIGKGDDKLQEIDNKVVLNKDENTKTPFAKIPYYVTSKNIRIVLQIGLISLIFYNFITTMDMFNKDDKRTVFNSLVTNNLIARPTKQIAYTSNYILVILNIIILIQQFSFKSCKLNLPSSWDF